jgi:hypothetical protein
MTAVLNTWSSADKRAFLIRMCQHGNQWLEPFTGSAARTLGADGGHYQWNQAVGAMWLDATGQNDRSTELFTIAPGNFDQVFAVTASHIANDFVRHTGDTKPYPWRDRVLSSVSGLTMTVPEYAGDGANPTMQNLRMTRVSDGDLSRITDHTYLLPNYSLTAETQASGVWANGDTVYFQPGFTITEGQLQWSLRGPTAINLFSPTPNANYLGLQSWSGQVLLMRSLGIVAPIFENAADFVALCNAGSYPAASPYAYPDLRKTTLETQVWNAHFATALAVPSRPGF